MLLLILFMMSSIRLIRGFLLGGQEAMLLCERPMTRILDCSWLLGDPSNAKARADFQLERIPHSQFFDIENVKDPGSPLPHMLPTPEMFSDKIEGLGVSNENHVLLYARKGCFSAARVWWMLRAFGHDNVSVLNGGYEEWKRCGGAVERGPSPIPARGSFRSVLRKDLVKTLDEMKAIVRDGNVQVIDARPSPRFNGLAPEPRPGLAMGHMPGALNVPFIEVVDGEDFSKYKSAEDIQRAFAAAGVDLSKTTVFTCGSGVTAAVLSSCFHVLGASGGAIYDGSWAEWGAIDSLPKAP